jgi:hypothetical protein
MLEIQAHFQRLTDTTLSEVYDAIGVYVLWSGRATLRPSYIGEGNVLKRFVDHMGKSWATRPLRGVMALMQEGTAKERKWKVETVESLLLYIAADVACFPSKNLSGGKVSGLEKLLRRQKGDVDALRVTISGQDPLMPPERPPLRTPRCIDICEQGVRQWSVKHPWHHRRRRRRTT